MEQFRDVNDIDSGIVFYNCDVSEDDQADDKDDELTGIERY